MNITEFFKRYASPRTPLCTELVRTNSSQGQMTALVEEISALYKNLVVGEIQRSPSFGYTIHFYIAPDKATAEAKAEVFEQRSDTEIGALLKAQIKQRLQRL